MAKRKCCKSCKMFIDGSECPVCKTSNFTTNWQGRLHILDANKSEVAKKIGVGMKGEYAIKCR